MPRSDRSRQPVSGVAGRNERIERAAIFHGEPKRAVVEHLNGDATLVHLSMMEAAQENEVGKTSLAAVRLPALRPRWHRSPGGARFRRQATAGGCSPGVGSSAAADVSAEVRCFW